MNLPSSLLLLGVRIPVDAEEPLLELLAGDGYYPTTHFDADTQSSVLNIFMEDPATLPAVRDALGRAAVLLGLDLTPEESTVPAENWTESWKKFFHITRVSDRIVIRPVWEPYTAQPRDVVIDIEPGMSFGTGCHGTTQACLRFLDELAVENPNRSVLDMGCGSGILAIAAVKLGFPSVAAFDNDPDAVKIACENAAQNNCANLVATLDDLAATTLHADVVVANILAPVLIQYAAHISQCVVGENQALVISGILDEQYSAVLDAFRAHGFREHKNLLIDIWRSGWLVRP